MGHIFSHFKKPSLGIILLLVSVSRSGQFYLHASECPKDITAWADRSKIFICDFSQLYHCIRNIDNELVETCIDRKKILSEKEGCPHVTFVDGKAYFVQPYVPCDQIPPGCPKKGHETYYSNQLYLYPACINNGNDSATTKRKVSFIYATATNTPITTTPYDIDRTISELGWYVFLAIPIITVIAIPSVICVGVVKGRYRGDASSELARETSEDI